MKKIILASSSGRRAAILSSCGIKHEVIPAYADEVSGSGDEIENIVEVNARLKAEKIAGIEKDSLIIAADTLVLCDKTIVGKPRDEEYARKILSDLSGRAISVYTGLAVIDPGSGKSSSGVDISYINVSKLTGEEVARYFSLLGPYDKAGGFSIEGIGSLIFDDIKGSYFNILGLPMIKLKELFKDIGEDILDYVVIE